MKSRKCIIILSLFFVLSSILLSAQEKLVFAISYIRHGDRAPYQIVDTIKHDWAEGEGSLTELGMQQEYLLGKQYRIRYIDQLQLLPKEYKKGTLLVYSTSYDRTTTSSESFLYGFYPLKTGPKLDTGEYALPEGFQPIPIRTMSDKDNNIINPEISNRQECKSATEEYSFSTPEWREENNRHTEDFKRWSQILDVKIDNLRDLLVPADNINCLLKHGYSLPEGLTKEDADKMTSLALRACVLRFYPKEVAFLYASPFLTKVSDDMQAVLTSQQKAQYIIYFGHDDPLNAIMVALNNPPNISVPYASHLNIELYKDDTNYTVKVFFNDKAISLTDDRQKESYSLEEFSNIIKHYYKK